MQRDGRTVQLRSVARSRELSQALSSKQKDLSENEQSSRENDRRTASKKDEGHNHVDDTMKPTRSPT